MWLNAGGDATATLAAVLSVRHRQYARYFQMGEVANIEETAKTACEHNMDSEEVMGMFSDRDTYQQLFVSCQLELRL